MDVMLTRDRKNQMAGAGAVLILWAVVTVYHQVQTWFEPPFDSGKWHDRTTSDQELLGMLPDLTNNVIRPNRTSTADIVRLLGPPTDQFKDSLYYGLPQRPSAFDATYLIFKTNTAGRVTETLIVDH